MDLEKISSDKQPPEFNLDTGKLLPAHTLLRTGMHFLPFKLNLGTRTQKLSELKQSCR